MQAWESFLQRQEQELGVDTVRRWLRSLQILRFDACNLYLQAADSFQILWFEEHIRAKAHRQLFNNSQKRIKVHLSVPGNTATAPSPPQPIPQPASFALSFNTIDPSCTLSSFVTTSENLLTYKLLCQVLGEEHDPDRKTPHKLGYFNPIYLYGGKGSGKTHLLMACANALKNQGFKALYVRSETFTEHVVAAIRAGEMKVFRDVYRTHDVLIIDDIHHLSRKGATQEELFHTFNTLHIEGRQILLSANCTPNELKAIEPRLISRFEWGIVLPLPQPTRSDLERILHAKTAAMHFPLSSKGEEFLLNHFSSTPKALMRALDALVLRYNLQPQMPSQNLLSAPMIKHMLADLLTEEEKSAITAPKIIQVTSEAFGLCCDDLKGKDKTRNCVLARQLAMYLCRHQLKLSLTEIGSAFAKHHTTVLASIRLVETALSKEDKALSKEDKELFSQLSAITKQLQEQS